MKHTIVLAMIALVLFSGCVNQTQAGATQAALPTATGPAQQDTEQTPQTAATDSGQLQQVELSIEGLWCESCVYGIESVMKQTPGIRSADIRITDYLAQTGTAKVTYEPGKITKEGVAKLTEPYPSKIVKAFPVN